LQQRIEADEQDAAAERGQFGERQQSLARDVGVR
jgi:hypothetical protein